MVALAILVSFPAHTSDVRGRDNSRQDIPRGSSKPLHLPLPSVRAREAILPIPLKSRPYFDPVDRSQRCRKGKG